MRTFLQLVRCHIAQIGSLNVFYRSERIFSNNDTNIVFASHLITQFHDDVTRDEKNVLVEHIAVM